MPDHKWQALLESVLTNVEPDAERRERLKARLRERDHLSSVYGAWCSGGDPTLLARIIRRLAKEVR